MDEILSKCYALRAGLSAISVERDKVDKLNDIIKKNQSSKDSQIYQKRKQISRNHNLIGQEKRKVIEGEAQVDKKWKFLIVGLSIFIVYCLISIGVVLHFVIREIKEDKIRNVIILILSSIMLFVLTGFCVYWLFASIKAYKKHIIIARVINRESAEAAQNIVILKQEIEELTKQIDIENTEFQQETKPKQALMESKAKDGFLLYEAMQKEFSNFLNESDWKYIDLLIFYFETGRAENLKEALQLVDKQVQTDMIVGAIHTASEGICNVLNANFAKLQNGLAECFCVISKQITTMQQQQNQQFQRLVEATNMSNALLLKANVNSIKLMEDVERICAIGGKVQSSVNYMRTITENNEVRRRNNVEEF